METLSKIFTPERRQLIQLWLGSLAPLLILGGFATQAQTEQWLILIGAAFQAFAAILSLVNVRRGDWSTGWMVIRGAIYAFAATASPVLVVLGLYDESTNAALLTAISLGLSSLSGLLAIFIGKTEQLETVKRELVDREATIAAFVPAHQRGLD